MAAKCPSRIEGNLEISKRRTGVFIGGDPDGLRSLARLLLWLANVDQESHPTMPDGEREHVHLYAGDSAVANRSLSQFSVLTELCRLDAKGSGEFPAKYRKLLGDKRKRPATKMGRVKKKKRTTAHKRGHA